MNGVPGQPGVTSDRGRAIFRGGNCFVQARSDEYKAGILTLVTPYTSFNPTGANSFGPGIVGRKDSDIAGILVMTSTAGTPAAVTPATLTATYAIIAENYDVRLFMGPELRMVPWRLRFLLYAGPYWFVTS